MGIKALNWALDVKGIKSGPKLVLLVLANCANDATGQCWPGLETIGEKCCMSRAAVIDNINKLIGLNLVSSKMRYNENGHRSSNIYFLNMNLSPDSALSSNLGLSPESLRSNSERLSLESGRGVVQNLDGYIEPKVEPKEDPKKLCHEEQIFEYWKTTMGYGQSHFDDKRKKIIKRALKWKYTPEQICEAILGCSLTPYNMGDNDRHERYDSIALILRDGGQIDRFIRNSKNPPPPRQNGGHYASNKTTRRKTNSEIYDDVMHPEREITLNSSTIIDGEVIHIPNG